MSDKAVTPITHIRYTAAKEDKQNLSLKLLKCATRPEMSKLMSWSSALLLCWLRCCGEDHEKLEFNNEVLKVVRVFCGKQDCSCQIHAFHASVKHEVEKDKK